MKRDIALFSTSRLLRSFALLVLSVSSPFYLLQFGLSNLQTGLVLFASYFGSTAAIYYYPKLRISSRATVSLYTTVFALSIFSILIFQDLPVFIAALILGGISLSGKDMTPNQPLEQYSIGSITEDQKEKNGAFSFYNFMAYGGDMIGAMFLYLLGGRSFTLIFIVSGVFVTLSLIPYAFAKFAEPGEQAKQKKLQGETRRTARDLAGLFAVDSFAGGLITSSVMSLWFNIEYGTSLQENGLIFFIVTAITAVSILYSGPVSTRLGLVRSMVYTHIISNFFLILMPVIHSLLYSEVLLYIRQATSQMDVAPRDSLINTIIDKESRVKTNSLFLTSRNVAQVPSPAVGGFLIDLFPASLLYAAGAIKATYDISLYYRFRHYHV